MATRRLDLGRPPSNLNETRWGWLIKAIRLLEEVSGTWLQIDNGVIDLGTGQAFASLPASPTKGMIAVVTNSSVSTWGGTADGAGATSVLVWYNGTNWKVIGA